MLRLLAIPLFILSGLPNDPPNTETPIDLAMQQFTDLATEPTSNMEPGIFHSGVVAKFGLNKTALRPQPNRRYNVDISIRPADKNRENECRGIDQSKKTSNGRQSAELVSPFSVTLFF